MGNNIREKHGGNVYEAMRRLGGERTDFLDFSANINPLGLSPSIRTSLEQAMDAIVCYPDPEAVELKQAIAKCYRRQEEQIEVGNGAVELIYLLCRALEPRRVLLPSPTFGEYAAGARSVGVLMKEILLDAKVGFKPDVETLARTLRKRDLMFFCNPNNPTGVVLTREELEPLVVAAERVGAWIVVDESFIDFRLEREIESCKTLLDRYSSVMVLHSLTKFLAIPGLRLGFLLGHNNTIARLRVLRDPWNVNTMAQIAGVVGLADLDFRRRTVELVRTEKAFLFTEFQKLSGCRPLSPSVNFMLTDIGESGRDAKQLQEALWSHRIMIRDCGSFAGLSSRYIRVAVKGPEENHQLIQIMKMLFCGEGL